MELRRRISGRTSNSITYSGIDLLSPPAYSPDLAPYVLWLLHESKDHLCGKLFETREYIMSAVAEQLSFPNDDDF